MVELRGSGQKSNRDAVGAVAELVTDRKRLVRTVQSGAGFLSQSSRRLHFAMEPGEMARSLVVTWPVATSRRGMLCRGEGLCG